MKTTQKNSSFNPRGGGNHWAYKASRKADTSISKRRKHGVKNPQGVKKQSKKVRKRKIARVNQTRKEKNGKRHRVGGRPKFNV